MFTACWMIITSLLIETPDSNLIKPKQLHVYERQSVTINEEMQRAYDSGGHSMKEIEEHFELHYSRISRIINGK
jgi:hypothetical protein